MSDYATVAQIKAFAREAEALADDLWAILATAASRLFDNLTEVEPDTYQAAANDPSAKTFTGDGTAYLKLPPFVELNAVDPVAIADDVYSVPDHTVRNFTLVIDGVYPNAAFSPFRGWLENIEITVSARWGFEEIPADVVFAVIQIAVLMFRQSDPSFGGISNADNALLAAQLPLIARATVDKYREIYSQRAFFC